MRTRGRGSVSSQVHRASDRPVVVPFNQLSTLTFSSSLASMDIAPTTGGVFGSRIVTMGDLYRFYRPRSLKLTIFPTLGPDPFVGTMSILVGIAFGTGFTAPTGVGGFDFSHQTTTGTYRTTPTVLSVPNCRPYLNVDWYETEADGVPSTDTAGVIFFLCPSLSNASIVIQLEGVIEFHGALDAAVSMERIIKTSLPPEMPLEIRDIHLKAIGLYDRFVASEDKEKALKEL